MRKKMLASLKDINQLKEPAQIVIIIIVALKHIMRASLSIICLCRKKIPSCHHHHLFFNCYCQHLPDELIYLHIKIETKC